jgi:hypothetical protein
MSFVDPVLGEDFFGREEVISKLRKRLDSLHSGFRQNIALLGPPESGKTSILKYFLTKFEDERFLFFYVDIKDSSFQDFVIKFLSSLLSSFLSKTEEFNSIDLIDSQTLLAKFGTHLPRTSYLVKALFDSLERSNFDEAYAKLFDILEIAKLEINRPIVVILEEFQRIANLPIKYPFEILGKKLAVQRDIMYIISSASVNDAKKIIREKLSLLFCNFEVIDVEPFDYATCESFIDKKCGDLNLQRCFKDFIIILSAGSPFYLNTICSKLFELAQIHRYSASQRDLVIKAMEELVFRSDGILNQYLLSKLGSLSKDKKLNVYIQALLQISNENKICDLLPILRKSDTQVNKIMRELTQKDFFSKFGVFYRFNDRLFKIWLNSVYAVKESPYKNFYVDGKDYFSFRSLKILENFIQESKKSVLDRTVELLGLFNNEMVEISSQRFILPAFETIHATKLDERGFRITAASRSKSWLIFLVEDRLLEERFAGWIHTEKKTVKEFKKILLISLYEPDIETKLLTKQEKIITWNISDLNMLFELYGKSLIVKT